MYNTNIPFLQHIPMLDDAETMSNEDARSMTLAAVRDEYAILFGI